MAGADRREEPSPEGRSETMMSPVTPSRRKMKAGAKDGTEQPREKKKKEKRKEKIKKKDTKNEHKIETNFSKK